VVDAVQAPAINRRDTHCIADVRSLYSSDSRSVNGNGFQARVFHVILQRNLFHKNGQRISDMVCTPSLFFPLHGLHGCQKHAPDAYPSSEMMKLEIREKGVYNPVTIFNPSRMQELWPQKEPNA
jgi:hypothetical protein